MSARSRISRLILACGILVSPIGSGPAAAQAGGVIQGHTNNPVGQPVSGTVRLTSDRKAPAATRSYPFSFQVDSAGNYRGEGIPPGTYLLALFTPDGKGVDYLDNIVIASGQITVANFDMSRQAYLDAMTPAERQALEDFKHKNAEVMSRNEVIRGANQTILQARAANAAGRFQEEIDLMKPLVDALPDEPLIWTTYADGQRGVADQAADAARKAGRTPASLPSVVALYQAAADSYRTALQKSAAKPPNPAVTGATLSNLGQVEDKMGQHDQAVDAFRSAVQADPTNAATYEYNQAAVLFNAGNTDAAAAAAQRALTANPGKADAYYIKAQALIPKATIDLRTQKIVLPPGCLEAYQSYLQLAPAGAHADEVRSLLASLNSVSTSTYTAAAPRPAESSRPAAPIAAAPQPGPDTRSPSRPAPAPPATQASIVPVPHNYALIFATDTYTRWPHLQNPVFDANALNDTLTSLYGFQVEELKNPTGEQILRKLTEYLHRHFDIQDQLMIVFSGHGYFDPDLGQGFLAPADALPVEDDLGHRSLLAHETLMSYVNRIPSQHVVLVIDACFAGTLDRKIADAGLRGNPNDIYAKVTLPELLLRKETKRTRRYFASGGKDFVPDGLPGHHSPFVKALLETLNQAADRKGYATLDDLQMGLNNVNPEPRWGDIQGDNDPGADFILLTPGAVGQLARVP